jgi:hypothetical protein
MIKNLPVNPIKLDKNLRILIGGALEDDTETEQNKKMIEEEEIGEKAQAQGPPNLDRVMLRREGLTKEEERLEDLMSVGLV